MADLNTARTWLLGQLTARGGTATDSDLLGLWQEELRTAAAALLQSGDLVATADGWTLPVDRRSNRTGRWTDDEISVAARAYISLLRADHEGRPVHRREAVSEVVDQTGRTDDAVGALFANISAVVQEQGYEFLAAYPPKSNVPAGVRPAVAAALTASD